jgi:hypothetical protein
LDFNKLGSLAPGVHNFHPVDTRQKDENKLVKWIKIHGKLSTGSESMVAICSSSTRVACDSTDELQTQKCIRGSNQTNRRQKFIITAVHDDSKRSVTRELTCQG